MATETEQLVVALEARIRDFERNFQKAPRIANDNFGKVEARARQSAARLEKTMADAASNVSNRLKAVAGALAASFTGRELLGLIDSYTRFTNQLKVAGLQGSALAGTQEKLFGIAQKYGVQLEAVGTLYGRNAASAKEMNLSQEDQLRIVETTAAALKVSGQTSQQASGALLQLSQALGGTKIQAEEYNSLIDGARPLLVAVAQGSDRWGGSVAKLTADVKAGNVAVSEFVQALLKGSEGTIAQAGQAALTTSAAFETLRNALVKYFGEADQSRGATAALAEAIKVLADNLDTVVPALAVLSTALGIGMVTNAAKAAIAARGVGGALLSAFGGPVGLAITGITVALVGLANEAANASDAMARVEGITTDAAKALQEAKGNAGDAATGVKGVGTEAATSEVKVRAFAGAVGEAAQKLYDLAKARQTALVADLQSRRQQASVQYSQLEGQSFAGAGRRRSTAMNAPIESFADFWHNLEEVYSAGGTRIMHRLGFIDDKAVQAKMAELKGDLANYDTAIRDAQGNLEKFAPKPGNVITPSRSTGGGGGRSARASSGQSDAEHAADAEKKLQERIAAATDDLRLQLHLADMRAQGLDVEADKEQALADIRKQFPELATTDNARLKEQLALMDGLAIAAIDRADAQRKAQEAKEKADAFTGIIGEGQQFITGQQQEAAALAMSAQQASAYRREQDMLNKAQQDGITLTDAQRGEIAQLAQGMAAAEAATTAFARSQQQAAELSKFFGETAVDGLADIITGSRSAAQVVADLGKALLKMALQALILKQGPLAGGGIAGIFGAVGKVLGFDQGGYTGTGGKLQPAGIVHRGEYVFDANATKRIGVPALEALHSGRAPAFSSGGIVGGSFASTYAPSLDINVTGGGTPNLANQIAVAVSRALDDRRPDGFNRSRGQQAASIGQELARWTRRNG